MKTKLQTKQKGFTIIEVLIVLAIAGLIILIVFLAVPALQRNSRNTQRKNDVSAIVGAVQEYTNNNQGKLPTTTAQYDAAKANAKLSFYDATQVNINTNQTRYAAITANRDQVIIRNYTKCNGNDDTGTGATKRNVAAVYQVETSGGAGVQDQCQDL